MSEERVAKLNQEIDLLLARCAEELFENSDEQDKAFERLRESRLALQRIDRGAPEIVLTRVEFELKTVGTVLRKYQQLDHEDRWLRRTTPIFIAGYILLLLLIVYLFHGLSGDTKLPLVGVPLSVILWACLGSLGAILYRFYNYQTGRLRSEVRWIIARPIIGIMMGCLGYLAIKGGLLIFSTPTSNGEIPDPRPEVLWIVAFLGGFSDRFFEGLIAGLLSNLSRESERTRDETGQRAQAKFPRPKTVVPIAEPAAVRRR